VIGVPDITDPQNKKLYFLRNLPADPMYAGDERTLQAGVRAEDTWGKRSYDSDADNPREGDDVYDVYSFSEQKGLNGIPYRQW
jgi:general secretion pathway protein G